MIKLMKSTFYHEAETKERLCTFFRQAKRLSMSEECERFEQAFAKKQERRFAVFVSSGSMANLVLLQALLNLGKVKRGDMVGVSALTWATNIMPILQLGLVPTIIDCEKETLNISSSSLTEKEGKNLRALFLTNVLGFCGDLDAIEQWCAERRIILLEDNCESLGSRYRGRLLGNFSLASTFSFFVGHHLSTIEGGMICTDDEALRDMLVMVRAHGWDRDLSKEKQQALRSENNVDDFFAHYTFYDLSYNARPTEIQGFLGNTQLPYLDEMVEKRVHHFQRFQKAVEQNPDLIPLRVEHMDLVSNFAMPVVCKDQQTFEKYKKRFEDHNVEIRPIIAGDMSQQPFYKKYVAEHASYPNTHFIHEHGFYFGNNPELTEEECTVLCSLVQN